MDHSHKSGNPEKHWIPGQARNDRQLYTYVALQIIEEIINSYPLVLYADGMREGSYIFCTFVGKLNRSLLLKNSLKQQIWEELHEGRFFLLKCVSCFTKRI